MTSSNFDPETVEFSTRMPTIRELLMVQTISDVGVKHREGLAALTALLAARSGSSEEDWLSVPLPAATAASERMMAALNDVLTVHEMLKSVNEASDGNL